MAALREPSISVSRSPSQDGTHLIPLCERCPSCPAHAGLFLRRSVRPGTAVTCVTPIPSSRRVSVVGVLPLDRQEMIVPDLVSSGSEIARWLEPFRRVGYCVLEPT
jgi:hypothetical protein